MRAKTHEEIVQKAIAYMQANLSRPITIPEIAKAVCYSPVHLRRAFRQFTGKGVLPYLLALKAERARQLLRNTNLGISEVALSIGFSDFSYFSTLFKRLAGMSPLQFRIASQRNHGSNERSARESGPVEILRDALSGPLSESWSVLDGEWKAGTEYVEGRAEEMSALACTRRLPENFQISLESYCVSSRDPTHLYVRITDDQFAATLVAMTIATHNNTFSKMERTGMSSMWSIAGRIRRDAWQSLAVEMSDDMLKVRFDGQEIFSFRDPFPGGYSSRCRITFGSWKHPTRFRNFVVRDLGVKPLVRAVRQGDVLFNAGLFERAAEFYLGLLESTDALTNSMELLYKLGMCCLRRGLPKSAAEWFARVVTPPENDFWSRVARLAEAEAAWEMGDMETFREKIEVLSSNSLFRDGLRELLARITEDLMARGFYERARRICGIHVAMEEGLLRIHPQHSLANTLGHTNRFQEAEALLREMARVKGRTEILDIYIPLALVDVCLCQGKWDRSEEVIRGVEAATHDQSIMAHCAIYRAWNFRGRGKFDEALALLNLIPEQFPLSRYLTAFAQLVAALTYCAIGEPDRARQAIERARQIDPATGYLLSSDACRFTYVPDLLENKLEQAADCLMQGGESGRSLNAARYLIFAGIIYEITSKTDSAAKAYNRVAQQYPANRYCYYATLAQALQCKDYKIALDMPYPAQFRSEMFYLLGLLCEAKGQKNEGLEFFRHSLAEDPTLSWPAALSAKRLTEHAAIH